MKNIVIISTMYYPDMGAPSAVLDKYITPLKNKYNFYIITKSYISNRRDAYNIKYITNWRHKLSVVCENNISNNRKVLASKFILLLINIIKFIKNQYSYPYFNSWEIIEYYKALESLNCRIKIDTIISVANTWTSQFAALKFKQRHKNTSWISFILDPFSNFHIYYKYKLFKSYWKRRNVRNEALIYKTADYLLFSEEMYKFAIDQFGVSPEKSFNIGFALDDIRKGKYPKKIPINKSIKMIYAGMFYKRIRNPQFMLETLRVVDDISVDLFVGRGECEDLLDSYISNKIHRYEFANRDRYEQMICDEYDVLLSVGNVSTLQAPSKTLELLSTGRPIIHFYFTKDSQYEMIEKYPLGLNIGHNETDASSKVQKFCKRIRGKCLSFKEVLELYPEYSLENKTALLDTILAI